MLVHASSKATKNRPLFFQTTISPVPGRPPAPVFPPVLAPPPPRQVSKKSWYSSTFHGTEGEKLWRKTGRGTDCPILPHSSRVIDYRGRIVLIALAHAEHDIVEPVCFWLLISESFHKNHQESRVNPFPPPSRLIWSSPSLGWTWPERGAAHRSPVWHTFSHGARNAANAPAGHAKDHRGCQ